MKNFVSFEDVISFETFVARWFLHTGLFEPNIGANVLLTTSLLTDYMFL